MPVPSTIATRRQLSTERSNLDKSFDDLRQRNAGPANGSTNPCSGLRTHRVVQGYDSAIPGRHGPGRGCLCLRAAPSFWSRASILRRKRFWLLERGQGVAEFAMEGQRKRLWPHRTEKIPSLDGR